MIGVVLWSDQTDRKAVFWCEDQGDLAYYEASASDHSEIAFFDAGDMVQFDIQMERKLRRARDPKLVLEQASAGLPETLRRCADNQHPAAALPKSAQIIAFGTSKRDKDAIAPLSALKA